MKTANMWKTFGGGFARAAALCLLALAAVLLQGREARAQWTTSGTATTTTGNVGIGTTAPVSSLHVSTSTTAVPRGITNEQTSADANAALYVFRKSRGGAPVQNGDNIGNLFAEAFDGASFISPARLRFAIDGPVSANSVPTSLQFFTGTGGGGGVERMRISSSGNLGIGTTAPTDRLEINGNVTNGAGLTISTSGTTKYRTGTVGTNVPDWGGQLINAKFNEGPNNWTLDDASLSAAFFKLDLRPFSAGNEIGFYRMAAGANPRPDTAWTPMAQFKLDTGNVLLASSSGNVGVGTTTPVSKLHVAGNITVDGNINAKYQDVAEWVPSTRKLSAGTVVVLDTGRDNHVTASTTAYDTRVAGVVSAQPGLTLGEAGEGKALVATTGRVKVKVDATRAAIRIGDLIVTSDVEGVGMKSEPINVGGRQIHAPGTIIGKALQALDKGAGEILVLLSLQ